VALPLSGEKRDGGEDGGEKAASASLLAASSEVEERDEGSKQDCRIGEDDRKRDG
jgi:hypothetical protein